MISAILLGFLFAILLVFAGKFFKGKYAVLSSLIPLGLFVYFLQFIPEVMGGNIIRESYNWVPSFGVNLGFTLDGLSLLFCLMITGIGFLVFAYTSAYLHHHKYLDRFYGYLSVFMAAMLGLVLSDNVISLFIFWELTSISSFFLIGFNNTQEASRKSALVALGITGLGGMFLLAGVIVLGNITGTFSIAEMLNMSPELIKGNEYYSLAVILLFGAAFTKSAQFPFHFWLPGAMKAPTPVSTYLHSATMVKAGIYLVMRFTPVLGGEEIWNTTLIIVGGVTMLYSAVHSLFRTDLKGVLAYSTISALGILMFLIGMGTTASFTAAAVFIIVHALYKATLFLTTGIIDHQTGTRDVTVLSGLRKVLMPVGIAAIIAAISSAGIPPTIGFLGKELTYEATMHAPIIATILLVGIVITKMLLLWAGFVAGIKPFQGKLPDHLKDTKMPGALMWVPPVILAVLSLVFGIMPFIIEGSLIKPVVAALGGESGEIHLALWHGFNTVFILSLVTITVGTILYFVIKPSAKLETAIGKLEFASPKSLMGKFNTGFTHLSSFWTRVFQNGYLRNYVFIIIFFLIGMVGYTMIGNTKFDIDSSMLSTVSFYELVVFIIMCIAILFTVFTSSRLSAVVAMGVVGLTICLVFVFYSAPDLAMTQFSIDTLTVILFVLVLYRLPRYLKIQDHKMRIRDGILSLLFGGMIAVLALEVLSEPVNTEIGDFYAKNSYIMAHGKNVVNVILVDFRGADTMIEISVLTIAAIGVFGLLKLRLKRTDRVQ
ncbi:MAG: Na(+)/H(+) antiporter subunit A [Zunongwangia sp.]|jgi:multicomponent Na+:H+ antiporter subunit A|uniref:Monovalent cation/H+ antiporter subunit A n=2 Tax=Zunongwangia profunda TaxID=398743 RepID=D5BDA5_ZUNPS|nr:putative monovalent cation/H+ antiporter subunit A [Zunongwangia profunda]MAO37660.1 Na(+)/H(+) antiporter subunit A [Zunongwangia sp.]ADF54811.1 putative monovalent cation/H+ antiporter subunit A [Zunongwangia profunda SM-A87]MAS71657.1 Na(+)/H(+) antiporter subunit A [Zunongwangia sp.]HAJ83046.1 putative monovalent cation/H+ antiporter subunit A [Zunongwangia profunda]HCV79603.1 putative monovalent cation/H+ antiporter subunit A [Zunongwangia profunda]|tara:strand:- start:4014 stop:6326 length:2313 start_codon:yes stop_codon:yes gene_type:complete